MEASGYESWFVSARDPASDRALWIRHTRHRPVEGLKGSESAALWCTAAGRDLGGPPVVVKEVFGAFPAGASAGAGGFRGQAVMDGQSALGPGHRRGPGAALPARTGSPPASAARASACCCR